MMNVIQYFRAIPFAFVLLCLVAGCGGGSSAVEGPTGTVSGKLTYNGAAVPEGCVVVFMPVDGALSATGVVGADGSFKLQMKGTADIVAGQYKISIGTPVVEETPEQSMEREMAGKKLPEYKEVPEKYRTADTSGETFEVKEGANTYDLDMKD